MDKYIYKGLQLFTNAYGDNGAGAVVNATGNYANAYTGTTTAFSGTNTLAGELKTFYDTELLENARIDTFYAQFAKKTPLPANHGTTMEFRKWNTFAKAAALTEGVIPTGQKFGMSSKTASINQYGTYATVSDKLELHAYDDVILGATEEMGASLAETQEYLIRQALLTNTNVMYATNVNGTTLTVPTGYSGLHATADAGYAYLTADMVKKAKTKMVKDKVPKIGNAYVAVIHPSVAYDLTNDNDWKKPHEYCAPDEIFNGEIGMLHGVRFIEDTYAPIISDATNHNGDYSTSAGSENNGCVYATMFFGKDAFAAVDPAGGGAEMIVHPKEDIGGPLNQFSTIGYKFETNGATMLYPERLLTVFSASSYSGTDTAN